MRAAKIEIEMLIRLIGDYSHPMKLQSTRCLRRINCHIKLCGPFIQNGKMNACNTRCMFQCVISQILIWKIISLAA